jgi:hypothetical protein
LAGILLDQSDRLLLKAQIVVPSFYILAYYSVWALVMRVGLKPARWTLIGLCGLFHAVLIPGCLGLIFILGDYARPFLPISEKDGIGVSKKSWGYAFSSGSDLYIDEKIGWLPGITRILNHKRCPNADGRSECDPVTADIHATDGKVRVVLHYIGSKPPAELDLIR